MKRLVKLKRSCELRIDGQLRSFKLDDLVEVPEKEAMELIKKGLCVPGPQYTRPTRIFA